MSKETWLTVVIEGLLTFKEAEDEVEEFAPRGSDGKEGRFVGGEEALPGRADDGVGVFGHDSWPAEGFSPVRVAYLAEAWRRQPWPESRARSNFAFATSTPRV